MKRLFSLLLAVAAVLSLAACGGGNTGLTETLESEETAESEKIVETQYMTINGICVDDSWTDEEESPLKMVYLFCTVNSGDKNLKIDSVHINLTINDTNSYDSIYIDESRPTIEFMRNYYYSGYEKDVYMGTSLKVAATFKIPEADLASNRAIKITDSQIPNTREIDLSTDDIQHFANGEDMAAAIDPEGYQAELTAREEAEEAKRIAIEKAEEAERIAREEDDEETATKIKSRITGRKFTYFVGSAYYSIDFRPENNFQLTTNLGTRSGTYSIRNGYFFLIYPDSTSKVPYEYNPDTDDFSMQFYNASILED